MHIFSAKHIAYISNVFYICGVLLYNDLKNTHNRPLRWVTLMTYAFLSFS